MPHRITYGNSCTNGSAFDDHVQNHLHIKVDHYRPRLIIITGRGSVEMATMPRLRDFLRSFFCSRPVHVVLDLSGATFFDCQGIAMLQETTRHAKERNSTFAVVPNRSLDGIMTSSGGRGEIVTHSSAHEALSAAPGEFRRPQ